jgi:hypothetical protein
MKKLLLVSLCIVSGIANAQSWFACIPASIGPDGCGTAGSSADQSVGPYDYYGQSSGSSGDQYIDPGDGQALYPSYPSYPFYSDSTRGFNRDMRRPYESGNDRR